MLWFFVSTVLLWAVVDSNTTPSEFTVLFSSETQKQVLKGLTLDSAVSLPLNYLNRCVFVALELTGPPPR